MPTPILEVALITDPLSGAPAWTNITTYLRSFSTRRARQGDLGRWEAGTATFTLSNADRRFEPYYTSGAYSPNVIPRRRIRLRTATYPIFDGFVDGWAPTYPAGGKDAICTVRATDMFKLLANIALQVPYVREVLLDAPTAYYRLNETASTQLAADSSGNGRNGTYVGTVTFSQPDPITDDVDGAVALAGAGYVQLPAGGLLNGTAPWSVELWWKRAATGAFEDLFATFTDEASTYNGGVVSEGGFIRVDRAGSGGTILSTASSYDNDAWHHIVATFDGTNCRIYVDGALDAGPTGAGAGAFGVSETAWVGKGNIGSATGSFDEVAMYPTALTASRAATHYASRDAGLDDTTGDRITRITNYAGIPLAMTTVPDGTLEVTGAGNLGTQKALTAIQDAEATEAGSLFVARDGILTFVLRYGPLGERTRSTTSQATFGDAGGTEVGYRTLVFSADDEDLANTVTVTRRNGGIFVAKDAAAETKYGPISRGVSSIGNSDADAQALAKWLLDHLKDPGQLRVKSMTFKLDGTNDAALLDRELHDRVTIKWSPPGGGARISQEALITGLSWAASDLTWTVTLEVSPVETRIYWRLGIVGFSELGTTTRLAA